MAITVKTCPDCGMRYNASDYDHCPYCAENKGKPQSKGFLWSRKRKMIPAPQEVREPSAANEPIPATAHPAAEPTPEPAAKEKIDGVNRTVPLSAINHQPSVIEMQTAPAPETIQEKTTQTPEQTVPGQPSQPAQSEPDQSLARRVQEVGKTTARFVSSSGGETVYPVVGWLVCVKGVYYGKSFPLRSGINTVGRSEDMEVSMPKDYSVSSQSVVRIIYDSKGNAFNAMPGDSKSSLCYINGQALYERQSLRGFEEIELGDSEENKFVFVPLCGDSFRWSDYRK